MRFTVRAGKDPVTRADGTILSAMGLPGGGIISVGKTHALVRAGDVSEPTALLLGPRVLDNAGVYLGQGIDAKRVILPTAERVVVAGAELPMDAKAMARALQGIPVSVGDTVGVDPAYADGAEDHIDVEIVAVDPGRAVMVGAHTRIVSESEARPARVTTPATTSESAAVVESAPQVPSTAEALVAGLTNELDVLTGWFSLLTSHRDLPVAWGLPEVAGVVVEGPAGCGKVELVHAAAEAAGAQVHDVNVDLVFKPQKLLDLLEQAVEKSPVPGVVMINRLEAVTGEEGLSAFKTQVGAILRWFLDAVAERRGLAAVLGVSSLRHLDDTILKSPLLPRTLSIPPPDMERREALFEAALAKVPTGEVDYAQLASRTAGFSGADILASVVHASAMVARSADDVTTEMMMAAIEETTPSLGTVAMGEIPSYGFERVAGLENVKQRLTEAVIWPMTQPERFESMGIDPPRILLYGPPGTGKTFVIRALAHESGAAFFPIKGAELLDKFVGESERGVREVFQRARAVAPSILFFDEIDALAPVRGSSSTSVTDSVVAAMLTEMDGVGSRGDIVVIGATNRKDLVDPALLRSGRFETHIELGLPDFDGRRALIDITDVPFSPDVDLDELGRKSEGLSFADLTGLFREAALAVLRKEKSELAVGWDELDAALERFRGRQRA